MIIFVLIGRRKLKEQLNTTEPISVFVIAKIVYKDVVLRASINSN